MLAVRQLLFQEFGLRHEIRAQILIVKKSFFLVSDVNKGSIQTRHQFSDTGQIDVSNRKGGILFLPLVLGQAAVLQQTDGNLLRLHIYDYFSCHACIMSLKGLILKRGAFRMHPYIRLAGATIIQRRSRCTVLSADQCL